MNAFKKISLGFLLAAQVASAFEIVEVKKNISLVNDQEGVKDFYIKVNGKSDLKKNLVVKATRKIAVKDAALKPVGEFKTTVGLLRIIETSDTIAVAREYKLIPRDDQPMLEQIGIMIGDEIDLTESFSEVYKPKRKPAQDGIIGQLREAAESPEVSPPIIPAKDSIIVVPAGKDI